jgi:hypothetical protein
VKFNFEIIGGAAGASRNPYPYYRSLQEHDNQQEGHKSIAGIRFNHKIGWRRQRFKLDSSKARSFQKVATYPLERYARINALTLLVIFESIPGTS